MASVSLKLWSSVGRKVLMAVSGLCLIVFVTAHLIGNLTLFVGPDLFNLYSHHLVSLGPLLYALEAGLVGVFVLHVVVGVSLTWDNWRARNNRYAVVRDAGGKSYKTFSSRTMIYTGAILLLFIVYHVWQFKYGAYYEDTVHDKKVRDLYTLVLESFQIVPITLVYVASMVVLGLHLRHAFWSGLQSLGLHHKVYTPILYAIGTLYAVAFAFGFFVIPLWLCFFVTGGAQ